MGKVKDTATCWPPNSTTQTNVVALVAESTTNSLQYNNAPSPAVFPTDKTVAELAKNWGRQTDILSLQNVPPTILAPVFSINSSDGETPLSFSSCPEEVLGSPLDAFDEDFMSSPKSAPTPPPQPPANSKYLPPPLYPLTPGGFLYYPEQSLSSNLAPQAPAFGLSHVDPEIEFPNFISTLTKVSPDIASRQDKLEKYRQKRYKRNWDKSVDTSRSERAQGRKRDDNGHFVPEDDKTLNDREKLFEELKVLQTLLLKTHTESLNLRSKLLTVERELSEVRKNADEANTTKEMLKKKLEEQQTMNQQLLQENRLLWGTVPAKEVFHSTNPNVSNLFKEKIDLSEKKTELNGTEGNFLEAARVEDELFEKRWEDMTCTANAFS